MDVTPLIGNHATEGTLKDIANNTSSMVASVTNAIDQTAYNLQAAAFSATTSITNDYTLDSIEFNFSTAEAKTITITSHDGTILWGGSVVTTADNLGYNTTAKHFNLIFDQSFNASENITVAVTQTSGACLMDCIVKIKQGSNTLVGNPVLGAGTNEIGSVALKYYDVETLQNEPLDGHEGAINIIPYTDLIGQAKITGHERFWGFGDRSNLSTVATGDDVWQGTATTIPIPAATGVQMSLVSTSANDTSTGTGVRQVDVHYLDATGNPQSEVVTLNGTTAVNTVATNIRFVQNIHSETTGNGGVAAGNISIYLFGAPSTVYNMISAGGNMSLSSMRMIPLGKTFYMKELSFCAASNKSIAIRLRATSTFEDVLTTGNIFLFKYSCFLQNSTCVKSFSVPFKYPALAIIKVTAWSAQVGGDIAISYSGWLED